MNLQDDLNAWDNFFESLKEWGLNGEVTIAKLNEVTDILKDVVIWLGWIRGVMILRRYFKRYESINEVKAELEITAEKLKISTKNIDKHAESLYKACKV